ncbi:hypothetical protein Lser_V15G21436 [Lactuca serriola]
MELESQVSPPAVRGTYGIFIQISTCLGLMGALLIGIPVAYLLLVIYNSIHNTCSCYDIVCIKSTLALQV